AGALGALGAVALQSNVDFGVELLGIAVPITAVVATLTYVPIREPEPNRLRFARALRGAHVVALGLAAIALLSAATMSIAEDHDRMSDHRTLTLADIEPSLQRHPLDYYSYALAAQVMTRDGDKRAIHVL